MRSKLRPFLAIILTLALVSGLVAHEVQAAEMTSVMMAVTGCTMPGQQGCPGDGGGLNMHGSCYAFCAGLVALMSAPIYLYIFGTLGVVALGFFDWATGSLPPSGPSSACVSRAARWLRSTAGWPGPK